MNFESTIVTLEDIATITDESGNVKKRRCFFNIPIYQRLYVWQKPQIDTLLEDLYTAFRENEKGSFYLGGILVVERNDTKFNKYENYRLFDLIDGQQRFTTLWLLSIVFRESLKSFLLEIKDKTPIHRIHFSIRPEVTAYLDKLVSFNDLGGVDTKPTYPSAPIEAKGIEDALAVIDLFKKEMIPKDKWGNFASFVYKRITIIFTIVPESTDLNKLFEVINNRGVQLQHHDILKARLISHIENQTDKHRYGTLWDACANMNEFVERNLKVASGISVADLFNNDSAGYDNEKLAASDEVLAALTKNAESLITFSMKEIIVDSFKEEDVNTKQDTSKYESDAVRSIISFPMLLLHTLRIWLAEKNMKDLPRIQEKELLHLFENSEIKKGDIFPSEHVCSFIKLLWEIRYLFDKYVIKWIEEPNEEPFHGVRQLKKSSEGFLLREKPHGHRGFALLQSMLYHSQQITTHYWLTPFLSYIHKTHEKDSIECYYTFLRNLDNTLFCTNDDRILIERSRDYIASPSPLKNDKLICNCSFLNEAHGLGFPHYWFYKLEFVLWFYKNDEKHGGDRWKNFTFRAKNSIEHISPQNPKEYDPYKVSENVRDMFGNLALVSRSVNSEFSNNPFTVKQEQFLSKNATQVDSLKMDLIYQNNKEWGDEFVLKHQKDMIEAMNRYFEGNK